MARNRFYITTAIPYANGAPHIGHAYERIATDAIQRFMRLDGRDVLFVTGMDEHGQKMQQTAARDGITPQQLADRTAAQFEKMGDALNARADDIVRTTQPRHYGASQEIWKRMAEKGDIYISKYPGWYSVRDEAFFDEGELTQGQDGKKYAPTGAPVEWVEEESYYFKLSAYAEKLLAHYKANPDFITPEKYRNEIVAFVERGLTDLSISRSTFNWGVPVPGDDKHVMYVWVDALTNYITATGFPDEKAERAAYWPADVHVIGKDITRFHAIYWPAFLMSAGIPLPKQIVVHGFLFNRGEKMSKSVGNVIDPFTLAAHYGVDQMRYFFLREVPFGQDGNRYFASQEPWKLTKTDPARRDTVLYVTAEVLRNVALMAQPFVPDAAAKLLTLLGVAEDARDFAKVGEAGRLVSGAALPAPAPIFPRYVEAEEGTSAPAKS